MNRIDKTFKTLKRQKRKAFIAYITAGDPDLESTRAIVLALERSGVDIVELGIPFSDPLADGPTIQAASHRALGEGATLKKIFEMVKRLRSSTGIPLVFMTYYNPVLRYGLGRFMRECKRVGIDGIIVPDLPCDEADDLVKAAKGSGIATVFLVAPTSTHKRIRNIVKRSSGFIYYVSLTGVTGARRKLPPEISSKVRLIKSLTKKAVAVGFGISTARQAHDIARIADGVIVGSALVKIIEQETRKADLLPRVSHFAKTLAGAIHRA